VEMKKLLQKQIQKIKLPISKMATNASFVGDAIFDENYYNWCVSAVELNTQIHYYTCRWNKADGIGGWCKSGEIVHYVSSSVDKTPIFSNVVFCDKFSTKENKENALNYNKFAVLSDSFVAPHCVKIKKIGDKFALIFFVQAQNEKGGKEPKIFLAVSDDLSDNWSLCGENGIVLQKSDSPKFCNFYGTDSQDIIKIGDEYRIYFNTGNGAKKYKSLVCKYNRLKQTICSAKASY
jgi:hypothetical protein